MSRPTQSRDEALLRGELGLVLLAQLDEGNAVGRTLAPHVRTAALSANIQNQEDVEEGRCPSGMLESRALQPLMILSWRGQMHLDPPERNKYKITPLSPILIQAVSATRRQRYPMAHQEHLLLYIRITIFKCNSLYHLASLDLCTIPYRQ
jgi:hypothetical protein